MGAAVLSCSYVTDQPTRITRSAAHAWQSCVGVRSDPDVLLCLHVQNQHADIREWVAHHKAIGVGEIQLTRSCLTGSSVAFQCQFFLLLSNKQPTITTEATHCCCAGKIYLYDTGSSPPLNATLQVGCTPLPLQCLVLPCAIACLLALRAYP